MGFFDRVRNFVTGQGFRDTAPAAPAPQPERAPEPQQERGFFERFRDRVTGADRRREQEERQQQERQAQERAEQERQRQETERQAQERADLERQRADLERQRQEIEQQRAEIERQRQAQERERQQERQNFERQERQRIEREVREQLDRERQETERREQARQAQEQARQQQERQDRENWRREMGIDRETTGGKGWTIHTVRTPGEVLDQLRAAADAGKRVGLSVHDKNGWHQLYTNTGRGHLDAKSGMTVGGGAGMSASEMLDRFEKYGVPGAAAAESAASGRAVGGGISPEPGAGLPEMESDIDSGGGGDIIDGPEWEYEDGDDYGPDDYYDYIDESDGGDDTETEGYDPASVNGYQVIIY